MEYYNFACTVMPVITFANLVTCQKKVSSVNLKRRRTNHANALACHSLKLDDGLPDCATFHNTVSALKSVSFEFSHF